MMMEVHQRAELEIAGGTTTSIFPRVEQILLNDTETLKALRYVAHRKKMDRYHSVVDFVYCEVFTEHRRMCFRYYEDDGPNLKTILSPVSAARREEILLAALKLARRVHRAEEQRSWCWFRSATLGKLQEADDA
jgi:hypothetical protein